MRKMERKKIVALFIALVVAFAAGGFATIIGIGENVESGYNVTTQNSVNTAIVSGITDEYSLQVESDTQWVAYVVVDGHDIQKYGENNNTLDLGEVQHYASITVDQTGIGTTTINLVDSEGHVVNSDNTNQAENSVLFMYLKMSNSTE